MLTLDETRPGSGDSGINVSPTSRSNASLTGISVHPTEDNLSGNVSNGYAHNDLFNIRRWRLEQGQWRAALHHGRNY